MIANNGRPNQNAGFWQRLKQVLSRFVNLAISAALVLEVFKSRQNQATSSTLPLPSLPMPVNQVYEFECSENADLFFRARAYGALNSFAQNGCQPLNETIAQISPSGVLYGVNEFQEIKTEMGKNGAYQATLTEIRFSNNGNQQTTSQVTSDNKQALRKLIPEKMPDPQATYVYAGVKGENGAFCRAGYKNKCPS